MAHHDPLHRALHEGLPEWRQPGDPARLHDRARRRLHVVRRRRRVAAGTVTVLAVLAVAGVAVRLGDRAAPPADVALSPPAGPATTAEPAAPTPSATPPPSEGPAPTTTADAASPPAVALAPTPEHSPTPTTTEVPAAPTAQPQPRPTAEGAPPIGRPTPTPEPPEDATFASACPTPSPAQGAARRVVVGDVDGDGADDALLVADAAVQLETAAGTTAPLPVDTASPYLVAGFADVDFDARPELLLGGRGAVGEEIGQRWRIVQITGCELSWVLNVQGRPYEFEVGRDQHGTLHGLACVADARRLVGTAAVEDGAGGYQVDRTTVEVEGVQARNGDRDTITVRADEPAARELGAATCGGVDLAQHPLG